jgi:hypothetical protein
VSLLFKKPNIIDASKVPSPWIWLRRWRITKIPLRVRFKNSPLHSRLLNDEGSSFLCLLHIETQWWAMFGGDTPSLQGCALRLVSQCCSSSRCERNWGTFTLIHTKVQNQLSYKKLHKLIYVNYNLYIRLRQAGLYKREEDPFDKLMELSLYDAQNLIRDWMEHG